MTMDLKLHHAAASLLGILLAVCIKDILCSRHDSLTENLTSKSCFCQIEVTNGTVLYRHGELETYQWPTSECHKVHNKCRRECAKKLDLHAHGSGPHGSLGFDYCTALGQTTPNGGLPLVARFETKHCPHNQPKLSKKSAHLCCGFSTISVQNGSPLRVFGWNPDCKAISFVIGS